MRSKLTERPQSGYSSRGFSLDYDGDQAHVFLAMLPGVAQALFAVEKIQNGIDLQMQTIERQIGQLPQSAPQIGHEQGENGSPQTEQQEPSAPQKGRVLNGRPRG